MVATDVALSEVERVLEVKSPVVTFFEIETTVELEVVYPDCVKVVCTDCVEVGCTDCVKVGELSSNEDTLPVCLGGVLKVGYPVVDVAEASTSVRMEVVISAE